MVSSRNAFFVFSFFHLCRSYGPLFSFDYFDYSKTISLHIFSIKASMENWEPCAYFMCNKNFADTVMTSYNDVTKFQILSKRFFFIGSSKSKEKVRERNSLQAPVSVGCGRLGQLLCCLCSEPRSAPIGRHGHSRVFYNKQWSGRLALQCRHPWSGGGYGGIPPLPPFFVVVVNWSYNVLTLMTS